MISPFSFFSLSNSVIHSGKLTVATVTVLSSHSSASPPWKKKYPLALASLVVYLQQVLDSDPQRLART
jgi:hypothetical protein